MAKLLALFKKAESYGGGSSGVDYLSTEDGSETSQRAIDTNEPSNGDGQGATPAGGAVLHRTTPLGETRHEVDNQSGEMPFNEALVDDNHANSNDGISANLLRFFVKTADETNFLVHDSTAGGVADSPQTMHDGHPREELEEQEGMDSIINNAPHTTNEADRVMINDKSFVDHGQAARERQNQTPDINKGRGVASCFNFHPFMTTSIGASQFRRVAKPYLDDTAYKD